MSKSTNQNTPYRPVEPWVNKYRPKTVDEVSHQDEVVKALKRSLETGNLPHLLFYGPPGTGKTSTILAVAMDLFGPELYKDRVLELNASDERGIEVVRTKIKNFASFSVSQNNTLTNGKPAAAFKLIVLDEADSMTHDAQAALRRIIEYTSKTTRFCLLCNYITRIIEPLSSRCAKFRFKSLNDTAMIERLRYIASSESMPPVKDEVYQAIHAVSDGDLRKAITYLQSSYRFYGSRELTPDNIYNISGTVPPKLIETLINTCKSNSYDKLQSNLQQLVTKGYPASQILVQIFDQVTNHKSFSDKQKALIAMKIGDVDRNLVDGSEEFLQLFDTVSFIMKQLSDNSNNNNNNNNRMDLD
ncbi:replication factor C subunit [Heterostelium album PN500]|uniref:Replication factor C subunit n=1 Tax=Heterostelium pallidum (strain ATCC 26659 / Pp 5 / PN500) TaxID=670386 RepID=D3B3W9_HETP5|nr:replication factor C subunit [Heterostelium album PN500]EFA84017.1 replication factor C subunit [Heterostelium album PN500]|eukprot:XP_020436134.1 replication factor C subunit [Heterostelium album PN500]